MREGEGGPGGLNGHLTPSFVPGAPFSGLFCCHLMTGADPGGWGLRGVKTPHLPKSRLEPPTFGA